MTDKEINQIKAIMEDPKDRWNILIAQSDRARLLAEVKRLRKRLSTCAFCGQEVAKGLGGHTSSCYERMLNESTPHREGGQPFYETYETCRIMLGSEGGIVPTGQIAFDWGD